MSDSLRLRITPGELADLANGRPVAVRLTFPDGGEWLVRLATNGERLEVASTAGGVAVRMSQGDLERLLAPDSEGIYSHNQGFRLMVEKDFPCAHPHAEEAMEPETERFDPTPAFLDRKARTLGAC